jgi:hypothetical protein
VESVANDLLSVLKVADRLRQIDETTAAVKPVPAQMVEEGNAGPFDRFGCQ